MSLVVADRQGPAGATTYDDGTRTYLVDGRPFWSVTTGLSGVDKDGLKYWAGYVSARLAFDELPRLVTAARTMPCGNAYSRCRHQPGEACERCPCQVCEPCVRRWIAEAHARESRRRADEGTRVHDFNEWWALHGGQHKPHDPDIAPYIASFLKFVDAYGLTPESFLMTEVCGINRTHEYAGTLDAIVRFRARATPKAAKLVARCLGITVDDAVAANATVDLLVDYKSHEEIADVRFWPEWALQMAAYRFVETIRIKGTDFEQPMPPTDGAVVVQLRPDDYAYRLVVADDRTFAGFLDYLGGWKWLAEYGKAAVADAAFPLIKPPKPAKTTRRRATKKTAPTPPPVEDTAA